eukprot:GILJ01002021.1.p1 GENE.GILJ01002021.1~~GILJ01002021.1.p1  ORF type:complete len:514 (-),score=54.76 GILJ01002021.1:219-1730(-)
MPVVLPREALVRPRQVRHEGTGGAAQGGNSVRSSHTPAIKSSRTSFDTLSPRGLELVAQYVNDRLNPTSTKMACVPPVTRVRPIVRAGSEHMSGFENSLLDHIYDLDTELSEEKSLNGELHAALRMAQSELKTSLQRHKQANARLMLVNKELAKSTQEAVQEKADLQHRIESLDNQRWLSRHIQLSILHRQLQGTIPLVDTAPREIMCDSSHQLIQDSSTSRCIDESHCQRIESPTNLELNMVADLTRLEQLETEIELLKNRLAVGLQRWISDSPKDRAGSESFSLSKIHRSSNTVSIGSPGHAIQRNSDQSCLGSKGSTVDYTSMAARDSLLKRLSERHMGRSVSETFRLAEQANDLRFNSNAQHHKCTQLDSSRDLSHELSPTSRYDYSIRYSDHGLEERVDSRELKLMFTSDDQLVSTDHIPSSLNSSMNRPDVLEKLKQKLNYSPSSRRPPNLAHINWLSALSLNSASATEFPSPINSPTARVNGLSGTRPPSTFCLSP